jgi:hypothetical protein
VPRLHACLGQCRVSAAAVVIVVGSLAAALASSVPACTVACVCLRLAPFGRKLFMGVCSLGLFVLRDTALPCTCSPGRVRVTFRKLFGATNFYTIMCCDTRHEFGSLLRRERSRTLDNVTSVDMGGKDKTEAAPESPNVTTQSPIRARLG